MMCVSFLWGRRVYRIPYRVGAMLVYLLLAFGLGWAAYDLFAKQPLVKYGLLLVFASFVAVRETKDFKRIFSEL